MPEDEENGKKPRFPYMPNLNIAANIKTPTGVFALIVLVALGGAFGAFVAFTDDISRLIALALILAASIVIFWLYCSKTKNGDGGSDHSLSPPVLEPIDSAIGLRDVRKVFVAAPMASVPKDEYGRVHGDIIEAINSITSHTGIIDIYWGGNTKLKSEFWDAPRQALAHTVTKIREYDCFVLIITKASCQTTEGTYPRPSSVWWEAGMAIAFGKRCLFFIHESLRHEDRLPYYLRGVEAANAQKPLPPTKVVWISEMKDISKLVEILGGKLFEF